MEAHQSEENPSEALAKPKTKDYTTAAGSAEKGQRSQAHA